MMWEMLKFLNKVSCATGIIWGRWVRSKKADDKRGMMREKS